MNKIFLLILVLLIASGCLTANKSRRNKVFGQEVTNQSWFEALRARSVYSSNAMLPGDTLRPTGYFPALDSLRYGRFFSVTLINRRRGITVYAQKDTTDQTQDILNVSVISAANDTFTFCMDYYTNILTCIHVAQDMIRPDSSATFYYVYDDAFSLNYFRSDYYNKITKRIKGIDYSSSRDRYKPHEYKDRSFTYQANNIHNYIISPGMLERYYGQLTDNNGKSYEYEIVNDPYNAKIPIGTLPFLVYFSNTEMEKKCVLEFKKVKEKQTACSWRIALEPSWLPWKNGKCWCNIKCD